MVQIAVTVVWCGSIYKDEHHFSRGVQLRTHVHTNMLIVTSSISLFIFIIFIILHILSVSPFCANVKLQVKPKFQHHRVSHKRYKFMKVLGRLGGHGLLFLMAHQLVLQAWSVGRSPCQRCVFLTGNVPSCVLC